MLGPMKGLLKARYAAAALAALGAYEVYSFLAPPAPELEPEKMRAAEEAAVVSASEMPAEWRRRKLLVAPLGSDEGGHVRQALMRAIRRLDRAELVPPPAVTEEIARAVAKLFGRKGPPDGNAAVAIARSAGAELVMLGEVRELSLTEGVPRIDLDVRVLEVKTGSEIWRRDVRWTPPLLERTVGLVSPMKRAIGWILFVLLVPWAALPVVKATLKRESNAANAALLVAFAGLAAALAYVALAGELEGWAGAFFLLAVAFGFVYNAGVLNYVAGFER
ncbi:MAG: hypothetical protein ACYSU0_00130 [Planctomycetota bacterium]|jgi:hypothetical protein